MWLKNDSREVVDLSKAVKIYITEPSDSEIVFRVIMETENKEIIIFQSQNQFKAEQYFERMISYLKPKVV